MNKKAILKKRGNKAFHKQIMESGGTYTSEEVSCLLGIPLIDVAERRNYDLLALQFDDDIAYPCWQFNENAVVEHFAEIIALLDTLSMVSVVQFFLSKDEELNKSPIDVLKEGVPNEIARVRLLAKQFHQQVAR